MATTSPKKQHRHSQSSPSRYSLHIELLGIQPKIWRRLCIDGRVRLDALHHVLQAAMGWSDAHLHKFEIRAKHYGIPDPEFDELEWEILDEKKYRLNQLLDVGDTCIYLYDFGDGWQHRIRVEAIDDSDTGDADYGEAWIESGERACPPDDAGGPAGYQDMLDTWKNSPKSDEAKELRAWAGADFDPARFDRLAANATINRMHWNRWIKIGA